MIRKYLLKARQLRQQLEAICPQDGHAKWKKLLREFRFAGEPRSVSVSRHIEILTGMLLDPEVQVCLKPKIYIIRCQLMASAAYRERVMLDQGKLRRYLQEYRENDYQSPRCEPWEEDFSKYPHTPTPTVFTAEEQKLEDQLRLQFEQILATHEAQNQEVVLPPAQSPDDETGEAGLPPEENRPLT